MENKNLSKYDKIYEKGKSSKDFIGDKGILVLIKDLGLKAPYVGQTSIISPNISENFTNYFSASNQTVTSIDLQVKKVEDDYISFGFMMELLPNYTEKDLSQFTIYSDMFKTELDNYLASKTDDISFYDYIVSILKIFNIRIIEEKIIHYRCNCSEEKIDNMLLGLGKKELNDIIEDGKDIEISCNFCGKKYKKSIEHIKNLLNKL